MASVTSPVRVSARIAVGGPMTAAMRSAMAPRVGVRAPIGIRGGGMRGMSGLGGVCARVSAGPGIMVGRARLTGQQHQHSSPYGSASYGCEE